MTALGAGALFMMFWLRERFVSFFLVAQGVLLAGYALFGRALAHVGVPPVYVGELAIGIALLSLPFSWRRARFSRLEGLLAAFMLLGLFRTVPYVQRDGIDALRDATLWGYGIFAFAVARALSASHFTKLVRLYRSALIPFVLLVPVLAILAPAVGAYLPNVPGSDVPLLEFKGGDAGAHLAGALAFVLVGLFSSAGLAREAFALTAWFAAVLAIGTSNRGGLLAATVGWIATLFYRPKMGWMYGMPAVVILLAVIIVANPSIETGGGHRTQSLDQLQENVTSLFSSQETAAGLQGTKDFRLRWWSHIIDYTVFGPYFWTGKGFGVNLADDDGFQVEADGSLRAPHNSHITVLARMGVPGFALWLGLVLSFVGALLAAHLRAKRSGIVFWAQVQLWIAIYAVAILVNTSFDPYLEGPQGGIWFWTIVGIGIAALRLGNEAVMGEEQTARREKGFGVNLASGGGFQVGADSSLRAPHRSQFTALPRAGLILWLRLVMSLSASLLRSPSSEKDGRHFSGARRVLADAARDRDARRHDARSATRSPRGTIWIRTMFGLGIAAMRLGKRAADETSEAARAVPAQVAAHRPLAAPQAS